MGLKVASWIWGVTTTAVFFSVLAALFIGKALPGPEFQASGEFDNDFSRLKILFQTVIIGVLLLTSVWFGIVSIIYQRNYIAAFFAVAFSLIISNSAIELGAPPLFSAYAYSYTKRHGVPFSRECPINDKLYRSYRGGRTHALIFSADCLGLTMGVKVSSSEFREAKIDDKYLVSGLESKYGVLINSFSSLAK